MKSCENLKMLCGAKIKDVKRTCDLIMLTIVKDEQEIFFHATCFLRIYNSKKLLLCSNDLYKRGNKAEEDFEWDIPGSSLFDDCVDVNGEYFLDIAISDVKISYDKFIIKLVNEVVIEAIPDTVAYDDYTEAYRLFTLTEDLIIFPNIDR